jgi:hypothetical protein
MHKNATKCNETLSKWCKNKHGASKIIDTFETYHYQGELASTSSSSLAAAARDGVEVEASSGGATTAASSSVTSSTPVVLEGGNDLFLYPDPDSEHRSLNTDRPPRSAAQPPPPLS